MGLRVDFGISEFGGMWIGGVWIRDVWIGGEVRSELCGSKVRCSQTEKWINWKRKLTVGLRLALNEEWVELGLPWGRGSVWVRCSLSLSLSHVWDPKMVCSENRNVNQFPGQSHKTHSQLKCFSEKFYLPCATKHIVMCKIISWNGFTPKQMQP